MTPRLLLTLGPTTGGIGRHVRQVRDEFTERGWAVTVAGPPELGTTRMAGLGDSYVPLPLPGPWGQAREAYGPLVGLCRQADVVHAHGLRAGLLTALVARRAGTPSVVTVHNRMIPETAGRGWRLTRAAEPLVGHLADAAIGVSPDLTERLGERATTVHVATLPMAPTRTREETRDGLGVDEATVLAACMARLHPQKRLDVLVEAAGRLAVHGDHAEGGDADVEILLLGDGPQRAWVEDAVARAKAPIKVLGHRDDVADVLAASDLAVLSSAWEGNPLALHEAARLGLALVGTDTGGIPLVVRDGVTGILVPVGDPDALAAAITRLAADPALRERFGAAAMRLEHEEFGVESMVRRLEEIYLGLIDQRAACVETDA